MPLVDLALTIIISGFAFFGLFFGFIHTVGSLIGTVFGILIGSKYNQEALRFIHVSPGPISQTISFIALFLLTSRVVGLLIWLLEKILGFVRHIPFVKTFNRLLGVSLGLLEGILVVGVILYFMSVYIPNSFIVNTWIEGSTIAQYLLTLIENLQKWFPVLRI